MIIRQMCFLAALTLLIFSAAHAADTSRLEALTSWMKDTDRWADDMVLVEMGGAGEWVVIKRGERIVGYHYEEYIWEPLDLKEIELNGITKVTFGSPGLREGGSPLQIAITEPSEIRLWVEAYKNHTQYQRGYSVFVPLGDDSGFKSSRKEVEYGGGCLCDMGVRYYAGEKVMLMVKGHFIDSGFIDLRTKNEMLHLLVKAKFPKVALPKKDNQTQAESDPFQDSPSSEKKD